MLSNLSLPLVGAVDTAVVGHLPDPTYIGAVAIGAIVFNFIYWGFGFLRMGTTGLVAQAFGAGNPDEVHALLIRALLIAVAFGLVLIVLQIPIARLAFWSLGADPQVEALAETYYAIRIWSAPAALANYAVLGLLIGLRNTRAALAVQLALNGCNIVLDLVLVPGLGFGIEGVAIASLASEYAAALLGVWVSLRVLAKLGGRLRPRDIVNRVRLVALLRLNTNIFIRTLCVIFAFSYFTATSAELGVTVLAVNAVLMHILQFVAYGLDGFAHAAEAFAGSAYGARDRRAFRAAVRSSTIWALGVAALFVVAYGLFGMPIVRALAGQEQVRAMAAEYLPWVVISPLISVWGFQLDGIFIGTTRSVEMRNAMLISLLVYLLAVSLLLPLFGNHGLWLALMILFVARGVTLGLRYPAIERSIA